MKSAAIYVPLAAAAFVQAFTINTPASITQCQPTLITWDTSDSESPYYLSILPGNNPSGTPLKQFDSMDGSSYSWTTDIAQGTSIGFTLKDSTGKTVQSAAVTIQSSSDDSCINGSTSGSASATTAGSATASSTGSSTSSGSSASTTSSAATTSSSAASGTTSSRTSTSSSSRSSTTSATSSAASASSTSDENGALSNGASLGVAGAIAALVAFLA
ncbi:hypothetical protein BD626DRAFT_547082 [Schizophyllum amplum]|uniref:Ser-Thr-rich glycosyl-phosphatidyl-inositol-anchored membrane family-domain-containing protein n=1 Tax=Schizophyllum amplum TaxID=97359 RepID=A0A550CIT9_9AGAR|nr:hypothetical protein BD626DRAFT_547082 [Auriculariopsis ampla]